VKTVNWSTACLTSSMLLLARGVMRRIMMLPFLISFFTSSKSDKLRRGIARRKALTSWEGFSEVKSETEVSDPVDSRTRQAQLAYAFSDLALPAFPFYRVCGID